MSMVIGGALVLLGYMVGILVSQRIRPKLSERISSLETSHRILSGAVSNIENNYKWIAKEQFIDAVVRRIKEKQL